MSKNGELKSQNATMAALWEGMDSSKDCGTPGPVLHLAELPSAQCWLQSLSWIIPGSICSTGPEPTQLPARGYRPLQPPTPQILSQGRLHPTPTALPRGWSSSQTPPSPSFPFPPHQSCWFPPYTCHHHTHLCPALRTEPSQGDIPEPSCPVTPVPPSLFPVREEGPCWYRTWG